MLAMAKRDQDIRVKGDLNKAEIMLAMSRIDLANQKQLVKILDVIKTPSVKNIGQDGALAVWLIAQHASYDLALMKRVLRLIRSATKSNRKNGYYRGIPYLLDRIRIFEGQPQLYGTQFFMGTNGRPNLYSVQDQKNLDKRRAAYGLEPFKDYLKDVIKSNPVN